MANQDKPQSRVEKVKPPQDWFINAILSQGSVAQCLDSVAQQLNVRNQFVLALKANLVHPDKPHSDRITDVKREIKIFEQTLRVRLGILPSDREAAWFRISGGQNSGPFSMALLRDPVMRRYPRSEAIKVRRQLLQLWQNRQISPLPFEDQGHCLWKILLDLNRNLEAAAVLPEKFDSLRLDDLPQALPEVLQSPSIEAFLSNVKQEYLTTRLQLDQCFKELFSNCERLWAWQIKQSRDDRSRDAQFKSQKRASDMRQEFRQRRQAAHSIRLLTPQERQALKVFGFSDMPAADLLKSRYKELARKMHPDRAGGDEQAFKLLTCAYDLLSSKVTVEKI